MTKTRRALLVSVIILIQSTIAIAAGIAAIYLSAGNTMPPGAYSGNVDIGGLSKAAAEKKLSDYYNTAYAGKNLELSVDNGEKYSIPYSDIEASLDVNATVQFLHGRKSAAWLPDLLSSYFGHNRLNVVPAVIFNESKLREKLIELSKRIDREPVDASVYMENGDIGRKAEIPGLSLNVTNTVDVIQKQLAANPDSPVILSTSKNYEIETIPAKIRLKDLDDIQAVLANYSTDIMAPELQDSIVLSAKAINGVILAAVPGDGSGGETFSFVDRLKKQDPSFENDNEGYDQVASTLYAAVLNAGVDKSGITRLAHKLAPDYIEPGLDAWISGSAGDLKFKNNFSHKLVIFADVNEGKVTVFIAGATADMKSGVQVSTKIVQRFDPPVVNMESDDLKPGEKVTLSSGKEGLMVDVYRGQELVSHDKYDAEKAIVQIGPNTNWTDNGK